VTVLNLVLGSIGVQQQQITVSPDDSDVTITIPPSLLTAAVSANRGPVACTATGTGYFCPGGGGGAMYVHYDNELPTTLSNGAVVTVTAEAGGVVASGTVRISRLADLRFGTSQFDTVGGLRVTIINNGPNQAAGVQLVVEPFHPKIILPSGVPCVQAGYRLTCSYGTVGLGLNPVYINSPPCAAAVAVTITVSTITQESDLSNNTYVIPARADAGPTCDVVLAPPPFGGPPAGGGGGGSGSGGSGSGGSGSGEVATEASPSPSVDPTVTPTATLVATLGDTPSAAAVAAPSSVGAGLGYGFAIGGAGAVALLAVGALTGWWLYRRRRSPAARDIG